MCLHKQPQWSVRLALWIILVGSIKGGSRRLGHRGEAHAFRLQRIHGERGRSILPDFKATESSDSGTNPSSPLLGGDPSCPKGGRIGKIEANDSKIPYLHFKSAKATVDVASFVAQTSRVPLAFMWGQAVMNAIEVCITQDVNIRNLLAKALDSLAYGLDFKYAECQPPIENLQMCIGRVLAAAAVFCGEMRVVSDVAKAHISPYTAPVATTFLNLYKTAQKIYESDEASGNDLWDLSFGFARLTAFLGGGIVVGSIVNEILNFADSQVIRAIVNVAQMFRETFGGAKPCESGKWESAWIDKQLVEIACGEKIGSMALGGVTPEQLNSSRTEISAQLKPPSALFSAKGPSQAFDMLHRIANGDHRSQPSARDHLFDVFLLQEQTVRLPDEVKRMYRAEVLYTAYKDLCENGCLVSPNSILTAETAKRANPERQKMWSCRVAEEVCKNYLGLKPRLPAWCPRKVGQFYPNEGTVQQQSFKPGAVVTVARTVQPAGA